MKTLMHTPDHLANAEEEMARLSDSDGSYMSVGYLNALAEKSDHLLEHIDNGTPLPDWVEAKISQAANAINSVHDFYEFSDGRVRQLTAGERSLIAAPRYRDYVRRFKAKPGGPSKPLTKDEWEAKVLGVKKAPPKEKTPSKEKGKIPPKEKGKTPPKTPPKSYKKTYAKPVTAVMDKHNLTDDDADEVKAFKKDKPAKGKFVPPAELLKRFLSKAKPETRERMKGVSPGDFMKMLGAIMDDEGAGKMASAFALMASLAGDEILARFEEGVPADPTENMSDEDAEEWERQNERNKDKFKTASRYSDIDFIDRSEAMVDEVDGALAEMYKITEDEDEGTDLDAALEVMARFEEGESVDVPAYLRGKGNPEAAEEWEQNTEEYGDKFKKSAATSADAVYQWFLDNWDDIQDWNLKDLKQTLSQTFRFTLAQTQKVLDLYEQWRAEELDNGEFKAEIRKVRKTAGNGVGKIILDQMGGPNRLKAMLGVSYVNFLPDGVEFAWPNKQRSKGNLVRVTLDPDDTYSVEFFNHSMTGGRKLVRRIDGVYNDMLVDIFEKQTGWYLRLGSRQRTASRKRLTGSNKVSSESVSLWAAVIDGDRLLGVTDMAAGRNPAFWKSEAKSKPVEVYLLKKVPIDLAEVLADQGTPAQFYPNGVEAWKVARRYIPVEMRVATSGLSDTESAIMDYLGRNGGDAVELTEISTGAAGLDNTHFEDVERAAEALSEKGMIIMEGSQIKEASSRASGLYGFTKKTQSDCEGAVRKLTKAAARIAQDSYAKDEEIAPFLSTHVKRANSLPAKILVDTLKGMGPKVASQMVEDPRDLAWKGWNQETPVQVVSAKGEEVFQNLAQAQERYPELDPKKGSGNFSWATRGDVGGAPALRFKHTEAIQKQGMDREGARKDWGLYGFRSKTANLGLHACTALREAAGQIAADLHGRRADSHEHITGFLKSHSKEARCLYSRMIGASYPDADRRCASAQPRSVSDWLSWED